MKKILLLLAIIGCVFHYANGISFEQELFSEDINLMVGETMVFTAVNPTRAATTNPEIVNIVHADEGQVVIVGVMKGRTLFSYSDEKGDHNYKVRVVPEDIEYLHGRIEEIVESLGYPRLYTKPLESEGKVMVLGTVSSVEDKERLTAAIGEDLAEKVIDLTEVEEDLLVEVDVEVVEVATDARQKMGVKWPTGTSATEAGAGWLTLQGIPDAFMRVGDWARPSGQFNITLDWLIEHGQANILSRPRVVCQSGKEAELLVGGEVPIITTEVAGTSGGEGTDVEYKEYGIKLNITPTVISDGRVQLGLDVEVSEVGDEEILGSASAPTAKAFPLTKRNVSTQLYLEDGTTMTIGGLIKKKTEEEIKKFPWLADVPILGRFFRHRTLDKGGGDGKGDVELFITITPRILYTKKAEPIPAAKTEADKVEEEAFDLYRRQDIPLGLQEYVLNVQQKIMSSIYYPAEFMGTGFQGDLVAQVTIDEVGELISAEIVKPSTYKTFDEAAIRRIRALTYPPFPPQVRVEEVTIRVPIIYRQTRTN